ncbi:MAG TPA: EAL domain-containing protein [Solirubrobacteraceae bacterium]|nr:EAL domain-containing protein [Solirubrobacteraceae bacterium]
MTDERPGPPEPTRPEDLDGDSDAYRRLLEQVPAAFYIADIGETGRFHYMSPQIEALLGYTAEEWCADPLLWRQVVHPDDLEEILAAEAELAVDETTAPVDEYRMLHRDGHVVWIRDDGSLVRDSAGRLRWYGVLSDITEQKRTEAELERRAAQQAAVARLGERALERVGIAELIEQACVVATDVLEVELASVAEFFPDQELFRLIGGAGWPADQIGAATVPAGPTTQVGYTILTGAPVVVTDWEAEDRFTESKVLELGARSGVSVTIEGLAEPFGVFAVHSKRPRQYGAGDVDFIQSVANVLADALARQATEDEIRHRALHDSLTGLPNRVLFLDRLEQALTRLRRGRSLAAVMFLDLDRFKVVNDSLGHHAGDEILTAVAPRLKQALRATDTVARFGGDEFGILLEDISSELAATQTAEKIAAVFARPFVLGTAEHFVTASLGIAIARGGERADELVRDADTAMYRAKEGGRARYELFDDELRARAVGRLRMETELRRALERRELWLEYQPVVSLGDESIVSVEALLRWQHPERGLIPPAEFVPVAEETGLIESIGSWVLDEACRQAAHWSAAMPDRLPVAISINLSAVQIANATLPDTVRMAMRAADLDPATLRLEITESVLIGETARLTETLTSLRKLGVQLVLDDFGTGYSALGYLTRLPLDALKIDRAFVAGLGHDPQDTSITEAIIAMARALSLPVICEGVETEMQLAELRRMGCHQVQGYYFSRPVDARAITSMLVHGAPWARDRAEPSRRHDPYSRG